MATFMLCWELGAGLGHVGRLKPLGQALQARGHRCVMMARDLVQPAGLLRDLRMPVLQAPVWLHQVAGLPDPLVSLSEILLGQGYLQPSTLAAQVRGWLGAFQLAGADAVIGDYAPTAILAAHAAGLKSATAGLGFYMPPDQSPLPTFLTGAAVPPQRLQQADSRALASVNEVMLQLNRPALPRLARLFTGDAPLLCTWPELDHYGRESLSPGQTWMGPSFMTGGGEAPTWPAGDGARVFAYLKAGHPESLAALRGLLAAGCRVLCYMPEVAAGRAAPLQSPAIHYAKSPVDVGQAMSDGCQLMVCHAGEATLVQGLLRGVPVLMLPMHREQALMASQVARSGAALDGNGLKSPAQFTKAVQRLLQEPGFRERARAFADRHSQFDQHAQIERLADAAERLLQ